MARNSNGGSNSGSNGSNNGGGSGSKGGNAGGERRPMVPLTLVGQDDEVEEDDETYIVVGEAGEDVAFEVCEDLEIALGVRDAMMEDGFAVKLYQAVEIEVVTDDNEPATGGRGISAA